MLSSKWLKKNYQLGGAFLNTKSIWKSQNMPERVSGDLPRFNDRKNYKKTTSLTSKDVEKFSRGRKYLPFLNRYMKEKCIENASLRVLDYGCGRGLLVAYLRAQGFQAYGVDISPQYIQSGQKYFLDNYGDAGILSVLDQNSKTEFEDECFDFIITNQVLEHVEKLDLVAQEIARISKPGGLSLHIFPAKWGFKEVHLKMPFSHWIPKNNIRKYYIHALLLLHIGAKYFKEYSIKERSEIYFRYSVDETFYRSNSELIRCFNKHGMSCNIVEAVSDHLDDRFERKLSPILSIPGLRGTIAHAYANLWAVRMYCRR